MTPPHPFRLEIPAGDPFTGIAGDVARRYAEVLGAPAGDADAFGGAVAKAVDAAAGSHAPVTLAFEAHPGTVEARLESGGRSAIVRRDFAAGRT